MFPALPGVVLVVGRYGTFRIDIYRLAILKKRVSKAITENDKNLKYIAEAFGDDFIKIILYRYVVHTPKVIETAKTVFFSVVEAETEAIDEYVWLYSRRV